MILRECLTTSVAFLSPWNWNWNWNWKNLVSFRVVSSLSCLSLPSIFDVMDSFGFVFGSLFLFLKNVNDGWKEDISSFFHYSGSGLLGIATI